MEHQFFIAKEWIRSTVKRKILMVRFYYVLLGFFIKVLFSNQKLKAVLLMNFLFFNVLISFCFLMITSVYACINIIYNIIESVRCFYCTQIVYQACYLTYIFSSELSKEQMHILLVRYEFIFYLIPFTAPKVYIMHAI